MANGNGGVGPKKGDNAPKKPGPSQREKDRAKRPPRGQPGSNLPALDPPTGRIPEIDAETSSRIIGVLRQGHYARVAAAAGGVNTDTFHRWLTRGSRAKRRSLQTGTPIPPADMSYVGFSDGVVEALTGAEILLVDSITRAAGAGDWRAAAWMLERRYRDRWKRPEQMVGIPAPSEHLEAKIRDRQRAGVVKLAASEEGRKAMLIVAETLSTTMVPMRPGEDPLPNADPAAVQHETVDQNGTPADDDHGIDDL